MGLVIEGNVAAAFTLQNVENWDSEGRASDYYAMAFFSACEADKIDFVQLMNNNHFWMPTREPPTSIDYHGPASADCDKTLQTVLQTRRRVRIEDLHAVGTFLSDAHSRFDRLICRLCEESVLEVQVSS